MNKAKEYREMAQQVAVEMEQIVQSATDEKRDLSEEETEALSELEARAKLFKDTAKNFESDFEGVDEGEERMAKDEVQLEKEIRQIGGYLEQDVEKRGDLNVTSDNKAVIPTNVEGTVVRMLDEASPVFAMARKFPSVNGTLKIAKENDRTVAGFVGEGVDIDPQKLNLGEITLEQCRVGSYMTLSQQLINDAEFNVGAYAIERLTKSIAKALELSVISGTHQTEFRGIVPNTDIRTITTATVSTDDIMKVYTAINPTYLADSSFIVSRALYNEISLLKDGNKHYFIQNGIVNGKPTMTLLGMPIYVTSALDMDDSDTHAIFGSVQDAYAIMIKKGFQIKHISNDTTQAIRGSSLVLMDGYMDGEVYNTQALVKLEVTDLPKADMDKWVIAENKSENK